MPTSAPSDPCLDITATLTQSYTCTIDITCRIPDVPVAADVRVTLDVDDACWADVDPSRVKQAPETVLSNAAKFSCPGGGVRVAVRSIPSEVQIVVEDTGKGMTADEVSQACELFWRAESTRRSATQGLGVGLTFVRDIVDMHTGTLRIDSQPRSGTTVTLAFARSGAWPCMRAGRATAVAV